jgi:hypothetical protein
VKGQRHLRSVGVTTAALAAALVCARASTGLEPAQQLPDVSAKAVVAAATQYVKEYAAKLAFVLGEESYLQETFDTVDHRSGSRRMKGEIYTTYLPTDRVWIAVHDVMEVDGQPVTDREGLQALLAQGVTKSIAQRVANRNGRFNIGTIGRNFNEPTLALLAFEADRVKGFSFDRQLVETVGSASIVTLAFTEKERPTIVASTSGAPVFSKGEAVIEAGTGRVRKTRIRFKYGTIDAELTTTYVPEPKLDMWVASVFTERYEGLDRGLKEIIVCTARYTNYRRFEVLGRIK